MKLYENFVDEYNKKVSNREALDDISREMLSEIIDIFDIFSIKTDNGNRILDVNVGDTIKLYCSKDNIIKVKMNEFYRDYVLSHLRTVYLAYILDDLFEKFPDYPIYKEGKGMGFFDLKNESAISDEEDIIDSNIAKFFKTFAKKEGDFYTLDLHNYRFSYQNYSNYVLKKLISNEEKAIINLKFYFPISNCIRECYFKGLIRIIKKQIWNSIMENYPEFVEGDNMGFFDLKTK